MKAQDFSMDVGNCDFGIDCKKVASHLRRMADQAEDGKGPVLIQQVRVYTRTDANDYASTTLIVKFIETRKKLGG